MQTLPYMQSEKGIPCDYAGIDWYAMDMDARQVYLNRWRTPHEVVLSTEAFDLLFFRGGYGNPVLIDPPCAGHDSKLADWDNNQSLVQAALDNTSAAVYCIEYKGYNLTQGLEDYNSLISYVVQCIQTIGNDVHLISLCQSGPIGATVASLYPQLIASLTVAGSPMNPKACKSSLDKAIKMPMWIYETACKDGVMKGSNMLMCWMSSDELTHRVQRHFKSTYSDYRAQRFAAWYYGSTKDLSAAWYLWAVKHIFKENDLFEGRAYLHGEIVNWKNIKCPINSVYGAKDDISPQAHATALGGTIYRTEGGHIGVFMGTSSIKNVWSKLFSKLDKHAPLSWL